MRFVQVDMSPIGGQHSPRLMERAMNVVNNHGIRSDGRTTEGELSPEDDALVQVTSGPFLCRLHVWTEREWKELPVQSRPREYVHAPGLGWVGAVQVDCMN
jgi:hypothetical protein